LSAPGFSSRRKSVARLHRRLARPQVRSAATHPEPPPRAAASRSIFGRLGLALQAIVNDPHPASLSQNRAWPTPVESDLRAISQRHTNSVYLPRRQRRGQAQATPRQIDLVGLKRLDGGIWGDYQLPCPRVTRWKPVAPVRRQGNGFVPWAGRNGGPQQESTERCRAPGAAPKFSPRQMSDEPPPGGQQRLGLRAADWQSGGGSGNAWRASTSFLSLAAERSDSRREGAGELAQSGRRK